MKKNIIIIGARGFKTNYGGWETFVTNLVLNYKDKDTQFYIPNLTYNKEEDKTIINDEGVICPRIYIKNSGFITMFAFTIKATKYFEKYIKEKKLENVIIYLLGCKLGPLLNMWINTFHKMGVKVILNPDGLEWTRDKWASWIKTCFKISERTMIKASDHIVCDSKSILNYVNEKYSKYHKPASFIAYGAYLNESGRLNKEAKDLFLKYNIKDKNYYLIVGRFIPENNYETMIREFMKTKTKKDLVIICNLEYNKFYNMLKESTHFEKDKRIKFIGSVYNKETLLGIRKHAFAYLHGHSAGGTNPSLLEALSMTSLNILFDVPYNKEVGLTSCFYFNKENNNLKKVINTLDTFTEKERKKYNELARKRIKDEYTWDIVVSKYKTLFDKILKEEHY